MQGEIRRPGENVISVGSYASYRPEVSLTGDISFACPNVMYDFEVAKNSIFTTTLFILARKVVARCSYLRLFFRASVVFASLWSDVSVHPILLYSFVRSTLIIVAFSFFMIFLGIGYQVLWHIRYTFVISLLYLSKYEILLFLSYTCYFNINFLNKKTTKNSSCF